MLDETLELSEFAPVETDFFRTFDPQLRDLILKSIESLRTTDLTEMDDFKRPLDNFLHTLNPNPLSDVELHPADIYEQLKTATIRQIAERLDVA